MLVAGADAKDQFHRDARDLLTSLPTRKLGTALVSDLVLSETATILRRRRGHKEAALYVKAFIQSPSVQCVFIDEALFGSALEMFRRYGERLSFADSATVAIMHEAGCETLFSHDSGFDGIPGIVRTTVTP